MHVERRRNRDTFPTCMDICTDRPYLFVVAGIKRRRTKGQRSLRTPVILDRAANENVWDWALRDFRYAGDSHYARSIMGLVPRPSARGEEYTLYAHARNYYAKKLRNIYTSRRVQRNVISKLLQVVRG